MLFIARCSGNAMGGPPGAQPVLPVDARPFGDANGSQVVNAIIDPAFKSSAGHLRCSGKLRRLCAIPGLQTQGDRP